MTQTLSKGRHPRRAARQRGQALVEFMFVAVMLLLLFFGLLDFGRAILTRQILSSVSREAANLASRGTNLSNTWNAVKVSASPLNLSANGCVILTVVFRDNSGTAKITSQLISGGQTTTSKIGTGTNAVATLPPTSPVIPPNGQSLYVAEVSYLFQPITPVGKLMDILLPSRLSDVAYF